MALAWTAEAIRQRPAVFDDVVGVILTRDREGDDTGQNLEVAWHGARWRDPKVPIQSDLALHQAAWRRAG